ncbi:MAG: ribonuclease [Croceibacterium sp.]
MAEWLVEEGIGEHRAFRLHLDRIVAACVEWPGELTAGAVADAVLVAKAGGSRRGTARFPGGELALVDRLPAAASEGASIRVEITRPGLGEHGRRKLARARPTDAAITRAPSLAERLRESGHVVRTGRPSGADDWGGVVAEALAGEIAFAGGTLVFSATPALLLVDVDGTLDPRALALAAVGPLADALQRCDVGGSVGVDFPTLAAKADRRAVDEALAAALHDWPHERTAMNGFGFVQLVARLERPSLLHRAAFQRAGVAARLLLWRGERLAGAGAVELSGHPMLEPHLRPPWLTELARRTGRDVRWRADPALALDAPHAQIVAR